MNNRSAAVAFGILVVVLVGGAALLFRSTAPPTNTAVTPPAVAVTYDPARQTRPDLGGRELTYGTEHFLIHFTDEGDNAMPPKDENANGAPDFVERVAGGMENSWNVEMNRIGFAPPPFDGGIGGDGRFDVYVIYIDYFGYSDSAGGFIGDNPLTPQREQRAAFSYMALDNTFQAYLDKFGVPVNDALDITSAHEFNHSVQYGYDANEELWLMESTAAVVEELVYPNVNDNIGYLVAHASAPDECLPLAADFYHAYSHWYFLKYIVENHPDGERILPRIWEKARNLDGLFALDAGLDGQLDTYWSNWVVANLAHQDCPEGAPFCMAEATQYPPVAIESRMSPPSGSWIGYTTLAPPDGVGSYGVDYIDLTPYNAARIPLDLAVVGKTPGIQYAARLVGFGRSPTPEITDVPLDGNPSAGAIQFDARKYERLYLTVENHTPALEANCGKVQGDYTVTVRRPAAPAEFSLLDASTLSAPPLVRPGESFDITLNLRALMDAEPEANVTVKLPPEITSLDTGEFTLADNGLLSWGGSLTSDTVSVVFSAQVSPETEPGKPLEIAAALSGSRAGDDVEVSLTANTMLPQPILVVDDSAAEDGSEDLSAALTALKLGYDVWNTAQRGSPAAGILGFYSTVIWTTGKSSVETLLADDRAALAAYVNNGGRLVLFGTDWAYEQADAGTDDSRAFIHDTLGVAYDAAAYQSEAGTIPLSAASGGGLNLDIPEGDVENVSLPDVIAPVAGRSRAIFSYPDGRAAAVQSDDGHVTAVAFDFSQLSSRKAAGAAMMSLLLEP